MKKYYFLAFAIILFAFSSNAQQWREAVLGTRGSSSTINFYEVQKRAEVYFKEVKEEIQKEGSSSEGDFEGNSDPMKRAYFEYQRWAIKNAFLVKADGSLASPTEAYDAYKAYSDKTSTNTRGIMAVTANWKNVNRTTSPGGYWGMGMATCVQFHPTDVNTFWVSSGDSGGLWKTTNGGNSYTPIGDNLPWLRVGTFCVDPTNTNVIYTCSGYHMSGDYDKSLGIYKTTDNGITWKPTGLSSNFSDYKAYSPLVMSPTNPQILLVGCLTGGASQGIYRTANGGTTWTKVLSGQMVQNIAYKPGNGNIIYACTVSNGGNVYRSTDAGLTWNVVKSFSDNGSTEIITVSLVNTAYVAVIHKDNNGVNKKMWLSTDSGSNWVQKSATANDYNNNAAIFSGINLNTVYMGGMGVQKSTDLGATFGSPIADYCCPSAGKVAVHADVRDVKVNPLNKKIYFCNDGGLYIYDESVTPYGNASWQDKANGLILTNYLGISSSQVDPQIYGGGGMDNGAFVRKTDGTWIPAMGGDVGAVIFDPNDANILYSVWDNIFDRGKLSDNWGNPIRIANNIPNRNGSMGVPFQAIAIDPNNSNVIVTGMYTDVFRSADQGNTWTKIGNNLAGGAALRGVAIAPSNSNVIYTHCHKDLYVTKNGGTNWSKYTLPSNTSPEISCIVIHPTQPGTVWVSHNNWSAGNKVAKSIDYGATWTNESGSLPNMPASSIVYDKSTDGVYVSMFYGVFYKNASMSDWINFSQGLPNAQITNISIQNNAKLLRCGTGGRGMWETDLYSSTVVTNCTGTTADATWEYINRVQFGNIDNTSAATTYTDFTAKNTSALRGSNMNIAVTIGKPYAADKVLIWCDWNNDKIFDPTTELAATLDSVTSGPNPYKGVIKIPANAFLGKIKMRIKMIDDANGPDYDPCGTTGYGEVEDYSITCTDNITSIDQEDTNSKPLINVYPTPIKDAFTLDISFPDNGNYKLEIANTLGQIVYSEALEINNSNYNYSKKLNLSNLSKGVYVIHLSGDKSNTTKKIIME